MHSRKASRSAFTLIELLVVIAIIAILAVVVVLTLNPAQLLAQSRDANRVSDMSTLNSAISLYNTDQSGASSFNLGSSSVIYISLPDPTATSTAGTNCASMGLPSLPSPYIYHCTASSTYRNVNGSGWIPVNLTNISAGSPLGSLPVDPTNTSSSRLYYTYTTNGTQFEVTTPMESQKYQTGGSNDVISGDGGPLASVYAKGTNLSLEPLDYGDTSLVGYWPLDEGTGTIAYDESGNNATGSWSGTGAGTNGYYSPGEIGPWAGAFDGSTNLVTDNSISATKQITLSITCNAWLNVPVGSTSTALTDYSIQSGSNTICRSFTIQSDRNIEISYRDTSASFVPLIGVSQYQAATWFMVTQVYDNTSGKLLLYLNGVLTNSSTPSLPPAFNTVSNGSLSIGGYGAPQFSGLISDVRIYDRALSAAQIAAMYAGGK